MSENGSPANFADDQSFVDFPANSTDLMLSLIETMPAIRVSKRMENGSMIVYIPEDRVDSALTQLGVNYYSVRPVLFGLLGQNAMQDSGLIAVHEDPRLTLNGDNVLLGFVDTGIDYTLPIFQHQDGSTRIKYIWDQTIPGFPPASFGYGTEYDETLINAALVAAEPRRVVPHADTVGHGTFLASVAAGFSRNNYIGAAPAAEIIVVKLRKARDYHLKKDKSPANAQNIFADTDIMLAIQYILEKSLLLSMPVSICIGLGSNQQSHIGVGALDDLLGRVAIRSGVSICTACGNEALAHHHTSGHVAAVGQTSDMLIDCADLTGEASVSLEIWNHQSDRFSVSITSPLGESTEKIPARSGASYNTRFTSEPTAVDVFYYFPTLRSSSQLTLIQITDPTPGIWIVTVYGEIILEGTYQTWLPLTGMGDPSVKFVYSDSYRTVTEPSVTLGVITVGAYSSDEQKRYPESSWGPSNLPSLAPDFVAPGENVTGWFPSGAGMMSGTSVSAAIAAGAAALLLEWGIVRQYNKLMNTNQIRSYLIQGCAQDSERTYPNEQWGYGRMNIYNSFQLMQ